MLVYVVRQQKGFAMKRRKLSKNAPRKTNRARIEQKNNNLLGYEQIEPRRLLAGDFAPYIDNFTTDWSGDIFAGNAWTDRGRDIAVQPDGKYLVSGVVSKDQYYQHQDLMLVRYNADFSPDTSFGNNGLASVDFGALSRDYGERINLQADGRILVVGTGYEYVGSEIVAGNGIAARFSADGTLEATYQQPFFADYAGFADIVQQSDGKYVILGRDKITDDKYDVVLTRLNSDFTVDTSFGTGGTVVHDYNDGDPNRGNALLQRSDGTLLVVGSSTGLGYYVLFNSDGSTTGIEATIDTSVLGRNQFAHAVLDSNDDVYMIGHSNLDAEGSDGEFAVVKVDVNLAQDLSYGDNGVFRLNVTPQYDFPQAAALDSNGNLVIAGGVDDVDNYVARATPEGILDPEFANDGIAHIGAAGTIQGVAVDSGDRIITTGEQVDVTMDTWVVRINSNVELADSFEISEWNGLWVEDNQNDWFRSPQRATDGSFSAEVDGRATDATLAVANAIDMSGYSSAELRFDWLIESGFDGGEYVKLDFWDGSVWNEMLSLDGNVDQENAWLGEVVQLDSPYLNSDFQFRFRAKANKSTEDANIDNVVLMGTSLAGPPNENPVAVNDSYGVSEDYPLVVGVASGVLSNDSDAEGDPLTAVLISGTSNGSIALNSDGSFNYTPDQDFAGSDSFSYVAKDGFGNSNPATVDITVSPVNDAPDAMGDNFSTEEDTPLNVFAPGVLSNDVDVDGDPISAVLVSGPSSALAFSFNSDGSFDYTPNSGFLGSDSFTYYATDGTLNSGNVTVAIDVNAVASTLEKTNSTSQSIPDQSTITSVINVTEDYSILDLNVQLDISHSSDADLDVFLIAPDGTRIELFTDVGGGGDNFSGTILDDEAGTLINHGSAPFSGTYRPEGDLSVVDGMNTSGDWTLEITDDKRRRSGTLNSWTLTFEVTSALRGAVSDLSGKLNSFVEIQQVIHLAHWAERLWDASDRESLNFEIRVADLPGKMLGATSGHTITIDADAAGMGWFVDATPWDSSEFETKARIGNQYDLLTVLTHELGHLYGHDHEQTGLMRETLDINTRWIPEKTVERKIPMHVDFAFAQWTPIENLISGQFGNSNGLASQFQLESAYTKHWQLALPSSDHSYFDDQFQPLIDRELDVVGLSEDLDAKAGQLSSKDFENADKLFGDFDRSFDEFELDQNRLK